MNKTKIHYLTNSWNPISMRCTPISPACKRCWHLAWCDRYKDSKAFDAARQAAYSGGPPLLRENELQAPHRKMNPSRIGVMFNGDLFHEKIPGSMINEVWRVMFNDSDRRGPAVSWHHRYLVLTKRPERLISWTLGAASAKSWPVEDIWPDWVWLGVTCENQEMANKRIPILLRVPAVNRWISAEPLLEPIDLDGTCTPTTCWREGISWVVVGCESGPGRRSTHIDWIRSLRNQCSGITSFFLKQMDVGGKIVGMPELDGKVYGEYPKGLVLPEK